MTKQRIEEDLAVKILRRAQLFYQSPRGCDKKLPTPITAESLAKDANFNAFYNKYELAFTYYKESLPDVDDELIDSHLSGINFEKDVTLCEIQASQKLSQVQVAWGKKGNYYTFLEHTLTPKEIGISDKGHIHSPKSTSAFKTKIKEIITQSAASLGEAPETFPELPSTKATTYTASPITSKSTITYVASEKVTALKTIAKAIVDTWSVRGQEIHCTGGGTQLYLSNSQNSKIIRASILSDVDDHPIQNSYTSHKP